MTDTQVLTFGETMLSMQLPGPLRCGAHAHTSVAGAESTVAIGLARLGHRARWAGRVGADEPGRLVLRTLRGEGVDVSHAGRDTRLPTGAMLREIRVADVARVHYWRHGSAASRLCPEHLAPALAAGARVLHLTGITCALGEGPLAAVRTAAGHARAHGWTVVLDVNHRARLWSVQAAAEVLRPLLREVDVLVASAEELPVVADPVPEADAADVPGDTAGGDGAREDTRRRVAALLAGGVREVAVKRGADGAELYTAAGERYHAPARPVPVVDTVGAGDAFCAGYLSGLLDELPPGERLARGVLLGAFAVAGRGDWEGLPHRDELPLLDAAPGSAVR